MKPTSAEESEQKERKIQQKVNAFATAHDAIADWKASLPNKSLFGDYSIQVENALVRPDKRPLAVRGFVHDIVRRDGRSFLEFADADENAELYLTLEATPEIVQQVLTEHPLAFSAEYVVIADVQSVRSKRGDGFHAIGRCVALLNLEVEKK